MVQLVIGIVFVALVLGSILACLEAGWRAGRRRIEIDPEKAFAGLGAVEGAVFGLMGLLMAFTFGGAASRFDARRDLIVQEANAIGTAYLRLDVVEPSAQPPLRDLFRRYVDSRLAFYRDLSAGESTRAKEARWTALQGEIWKAAVKASGDAGPASSARMLLLPALNDMIDITTTRSAALRMHPSPAIYAMLGVAVLGSSLIAGWGMAASSRRSVLHALGFAAISTLAIYVVVDLEFPRVGLLRVDSFDAILAAVRASMG
jgi:hypothetical protein